MYFFFIAFTDKAAIVQRRKIKKKEDIYLAAFSKLVQISLYKWLLNEKKSHVYLFYILYYNKNLFCLNHFHVCSSMLSSNRGAAAPIHHLMSPKGGCSQQLNSESSSTVLYKGLMKKSGF